MERNQAYNVVQPCYNLPELPENAYELVDVKEPNVSNGTPKKKAVGEKTKDGKCKECVIVFTAVLALLIAIVAIIIAVTLSTTQAQSMYEERQPLKQDIMSLVQEISQLRETLNQTEMKIILEVEMNNNVIANLQNTSQTQHDNLTQEVQILREQILTFHTGTMYNPASSCKDIPIDSPSGEYWIRNNITLPPVQVYCDMNPRSCSCNSTGGWTRVANFDMTDPSQQCPDGFIQVNRTTAPLRTCGRPGPIGCVSTTFPVHGIEYSRVCGRVRAYQFGTPNSFQMYNNDRNVTIDSVYVDGIGLTHGQSSRQHIWTFAATGDEVRSYYWGCPCTSTDLPFTGTVPPFIAQDYFCETGSRNAFQTIFYPDDPLWDGQGCGSTSACCEFNNPPWFCKQLPQATTDDIELRLCGDQAINNEDTPLEMVKIYIQ